MSHLNNISEKLMERLDDLLIHFGIEKLRNDGTKLVGPCPIHGGDNKAAFNLYLNGHTVLGYWKCRTHDCNKQYKSTIIGFVRALLNRDSEFNFPQTVKWCEQFLGISSDGNWKKEKVSNDEKEFIRCIQAYTEEVVETPGIDKELVCASLNIPSPYYLERGFTEDILKKYDVGDCNKPGKWMNGRAVIPIYENEKMVGCTGRSYYPECERCSLYHPGQSCPDENWAWKFGKWLNSKGFSKNKYLYNYEHALPYIYKSKCAVLVEGCSDVWKLEECGVHNSLAILCASLSSFQEKLLNKTGAMKIVVLTDNDDGGESAYESIVELCSDMYSVQRLYLPKNDVSDLDNEYIERVLKYEIEKNYVC